MKTKLVNSKKTITIAIIFGLFGTTSEIFFTAFYNLITIYQSSGELKLDMKGESYMWMFFIYSLIGPLFNIIYKRILKFNIVIRSFIYGVVILFFEFIFGFALKLVIGRCPWEYKEGLSVLGFIRLDYIFFWMIFGVIIEKVYKYLDKHIVI